MGLPTIEMCSYLNLHQKRNFFLDGIVKTLKDSGLDIIHKCPYKVKF